MRKSKTIAAVAMTAALAGGVVLGMTLGNPLASGASPAGTVTTTTVPAKPGQFGPGAPGKPGDHRGPGGRGFPGMDVAAKTLKLTPEELTKQLMAGKSLADIAKAQGVPKQTLIDALVTAGQTALDKEKAALPDQIAKLVDASRPAGKDGPGGFGPGFGPGKGQGGPGMGAPGLDAPAKALGMSVADLQTALKSGKTYAQIAKDKGVDKQKVIDALVAEAKTRSAAAVKAGKITQAEADKHLAELTKRITEMVDNGMPKFGPGGMGGPGGGKGGPWGGPGGH